MKYTFIVKKEEGGVPHTHVLTCEWKDCINRATETLVNFKGKEHVYCVIHANKIVAWITQDHRKETYNEYEE